jgi:predicted CXXCH cytochrome family protein
MRALGLILIVLLIGVRAGAQQITTTVSTPEQSSPVPAATSENASCLKCHEPILALLKKNVIHPAVDMGCATCHTDHQVAGAKPDPKDRANHYLNGSQPELCVTCHDTKDKSLAAAHRGQPLEKATCTGCHNPHGSDNPKLIAAHAHPPFAARECEKCHQAPQDGKVKLVEASAIALCEGCHTDFKARYDKAKVKHTAIEMDENSCLTCHRPHASEQPKLLQAKVTILCSGCHEDKPGTKKFVHAPVSTNCAICHDPHSSDFSQRLRANVNQVCLECHGSDAVRRLQKTPLALFNGQVKLPGVPFHEVKLLPVRSDQHQGHPSPGHPVESPAFGKMPAVNCVTCHNPHSSDSGELRLNTESGEKSDLCLKCHK